MRVIGGELGGRRLEAPPGEGTRPMLDRVREALFETLRPWLTDAFVLDLFAGSGSLGIEALSRGARRARFVERAAGAYACLRGNLETLGLLERAELMRGDALAAASWGTTPADVVLFDSPYPLLTGPTGAKGGARGAPEGGSRASLFRALKTLAHGHLAPQGVLVLHAPRRAVRATEFGPGLVLREREYGTHSLWYVQLDEPGPASGPAGV